MTVQDLLIKFLEYRYLWNSPSSLNSQSSKIRLQQIESLQNAFGLSKNHVNLLVQIKYGIVGEKEELSRSKHINKITNIEYLYGAEFLHDRPEESNKEIEKIAYKKVRELFPKIPERLMEDKLHLSWMFNMLINFRQSAYELSYPEGDMDMGFSVGVYYSKHLMGKVKNEIIDNLQEIDETLCLILDPEKRRIPLETLKEKFNYPDANLEKIDMEHYVENF